MSFISVYKELMLNFGLIVHGTNRAQCGKVNTFVSHHREVILCIEAFLSLWSYNH